MLLYCCVFNFFRPMMLVHNSRFVAYNDETVSQIEAINPSDEIKSTKKHKQHDADYVACLKTTRIDIYHQNHVIHSIIGVFSIIKLVPGYIIAINGTKVELYCTKMFTVVSSLTASSPVWAIDVNNGLLAVASQNIQIYALPGSEQHTEDSHDLMFLYTIHFPHKVLVLRLTTDSIYLSTDNSVVWNIILSKNSSNIARIPLKRDSVVWDIAVVGDYIVTADSLSRVMFYAKSNMTMVQSIKSHQADVLCLTTNKAGDTLYSSGIDRLTQFTHQLTIRVIVQYKILKQADGKHKWIVAGDKRYHSHDVKALLLHNDTLYSGGVDMTMVATKLKGFPNSKPMRQSPFPTNIISTSGNKLMVAQFTDHVKVWEMGSTLCESEEGELPISENYRHLVDVMLAPESLIVCSEISPNGSFLALSTTTEFKLYDLQKVEEKMTVTKRVHSIDACSTISFSMDEQLMTLTSTDLVYVLDMGSLMVVATFNADALVTRTIMSEDNAWLIVSTKNAIQIFNLDTNKVRFLLNL